MLSELLKKLLFVKQFIMKGGKIEVMGVKHIMLASDALLGLQNIDDSKTYNKVKDATLKEMSKIVKHAKVYKALKDIALLDLMKLSKKIDGEEGMLKTLKDIFEIYGLGNLIIIDLNNQKKQAFLKVEDSSIAKAYLETNKKKSRDAVCTITAAVLAGMFSYLFNKNVNCVEGKCMAKGNEYCEFAVK